MKTPAATKVTASAQNTRIFAYPKRPGSVCAEVLARLLSGEVMTAADALDGASTMRAAAHVHYLASEYGWPIEREDRAVGCLDGRVATVAAYKLPADCIRAAIAAGAGDWIEEVMTARAAGRAKTGDAHHRAAAINRVRGELDWRDQPARMAV